MNRGRVGEERGSKETDGCPLTAIGDGQSLERMVCFLCHLVLLDLMVINVAIGFLLVVLAGELVLHQPN
jgi:hypothetical protein